MKIQTTRVLLSLIDGTLITFLYFLSVDITKPFQNLQPLFVLIVFCLSSFGIYIIYYVLGMKTTKHYLQHTTPWDSPKMIGIITIIWWILCALLYFIHPDGLILFSAIGVPKVYLSGVYMRNVYRKQKVP